MGEPAEPSAEWRSSRTALVGAIEELGVPCHAAIAHSSGLGIALAVPVAQGLLGVGIDLEPADRTIGAPLARKIAATFGWIGEPAIESWCRCEACFKADPDSADAVLSGFARRDAERFERRGRIFETRLIRAPGWISAVALCRPV